MFSRTERRADSPSTLKHLTCRDTSDTVHLYRTAIQQCPRETLATLMTMQIPPPVGLRRGHQSRQSLRDGPPRRRLRAVRPSEGLPIVTRVPTEFLPDRSRTVISHNDSPDIGFRYSINPYRGCEHGCAYCYARPSHEYLGMNAGLDFESRILVKHDIAERLRAGTGRAQLARRADRPLRRDRLLSASRANVQADAGLSGSDARSAATAGHRHQERTRDARSRSAGGTCQARTWCTCT